MIVFRHIFARLQPLPCLLRNKVSVSRPDACAPYLLHKTAKRSTKAAFLPERPLQDFSQKRKNYPLSLGSVKTGEIGYTVVRGHGLHILLIDTYGSFGMDRD